MQFPFSKIIRLFLLSCLLFCVSEAGAQSIAASDSLQRRRAVPQRPVSQREMAQGRRDAPRNMIAPKDTIATKDTIAQRDSIAPLDSAAIAANMAKADSTARADSLAREKQMRQGMLDRPAFTTAKDSIIEDFSGGRNMIYYFGEVSVTYGDMKLTADYMEYDVGKQTVFATGVADSSGVVSGKPKMEQGGKTYQMDNVFYNFNTRSARIKNMITEEAEGQLRGDNLKMKEDHSIDVKGGIYTVCDHEHPHYYLRMTRAKMETQPKQKTVFGWTYLVLGDVPLYPLMLPFGFVPKRPDRASGILFPTFGEEAARGLFMKDGGFYLVLGDYFDVALTGSIYSKGSWNARMSTRYKLRYKFNGNFDLSYSNDQTGEKGSADFFQTKNFSVKWSHAQDPKARPGTSFRASVDFSSPSNSKYNYQSVQDAIQTESSSSISYSKTWSKMSLSVNALHKQNSRDSSYTLTVPNITFNVNRFYPFKRKNRVGGAKWYEDFSLSYNTSLQNKISFKASQIKDPDFWDKLQTGMSHKFNIGLPTFTILKYLTLSPSVSYNMNWFFSSQEQFYNPETNKIETVRTGQFQDFGATHTFSAGASLSTRIYGLFNFRRGKVKAIRHMLSPSLNFSYKPELGTDINGWRSYSYVDVNGNEKTLEYNKWAGGGIGSIPGKGQTASLGFSLGNNFEAKVVDKMDTTGKGTKKVKLIDNLSLSGNYNFLADSMNLSKISISMNTNVLQKVNISGSLGLDPYAIDERGRRIGTYNVVRTGHLARLTNASVSLGFSLQGEGKGKGNDGTGGGGGNSGGGTRDRSGRNSGNPDRPGGRGGGVKMTGESPAYERVYYHPVTGEYIPGGWLYYLNPNVPWSVSFNYSYSYSRSYQYSNEQLMTKHTHNQTLSVNGQVRLTKDLNINLTTGFDLTRLKLTTTQISATYDLHCFQISFSWVPMGQWSQWNFRINAKASALADLLQYKKGSSEWDR